MGINVEVTSQFKKAPAGQYQGVCAEVIDLGFSQKNYKNQQTGADEPKTVHEIQYVFQLNKVDDESGKRFTVRSKPLNLILSEKSNLRAFLLQWRGHDLTPDELKPPGVDVDLKGKNALLQVVHNTVGDKTYANIGSIMPLMEGMAEIQPLDYEPQQEAALAAKAKNEAAVSGQAAPTFTGQPQTAPVVDAIPSVAAAAAAGSTAPAQPAATTGTQVSQPVPGHPDNCQCDKCVIPF